MIYCEIFKNLFSCISQLIVGYWCMDLMMTLNLHFLSKHTDKVTTAAFGIAWLIIGMIIMPISVGINCALNQQASQAIGQSKTSLSLIYLNFTFYTHTFCFIPISLIVYQLKPYVGWLVRENTTETVDRAWDMLIPIFLACYLSLQVECIKSYLISWKIFTPFLPIYLATLLLHFVLCSLFITPFGYLGICYAMITSQLVALGAILLYIYRSEMNGILKNFSLRLQPYEQLSLYKQYLRDSIPLIVHIYADYVIFFILSLLAVNLGVNQTNAQLAMSNTSTIFFKIPMTMSIALITFIGNEMSQKNAAKAKLYMEQGVLSFLLIMSINVIGLWIFKEQWANFFTSDSEVHGLMLEVLPYFLFANIIFDGIQLTLAGVLKGVNLQEIVSNSTLVAYYLLGVPMLGLLIFCFDLQLIGIWLGFGIANISLSAFYGYLIYNIDWEEQAKIISARIDGHSQFLETGVEMNTLGNEDHKKSLIMQE